MKHLIKPLLTALLLLCCTVAGAAVFEVDGIYYNILSSEDKTVEVTSCGIEFSGAVTIPASVTYNSITYSVTSIGEYAFCGCDGLTSIEIPSSVASIGNNAFYYCTGLRSIEIPSSVTSIGEYAFSVCCGLTSIEIPSSVASIGNSAFSDCTGLTSIEIPSSVTSIGQSAFAHCYGLTSIVVDEGNTIYDSRNNCNAIIETASNTLIAGCVNTIISSSVTSIGNFAFNGCGGLTSIEIPSSVTSIGDNAFAYCDGLTSIEIPSSVTSIGNFAFNGCTGLTSIVIPSSVTSIGECAFADCTGLTSVEIPSSVTSIDMLVFYGCTGLTSIVSHISAEDLFAPVDFAFDGVDNDACTLYVPVGAKATYAATEGWKEFKNIVELGGHCGDNVYWSLDETTGALTIDGIGAMYNYSSGGAPWDDIIEQITSLDIKSGVTTIGDYAFSGCTSLTSLVIPSSVTTIGDYAFQSCWGLTPIEIPSSVTSIGRYAFRGCHGQSIIVDINNSYYDSRENCNAIIETATNTLIASCKNSFIPSTVTAIGDYAFYNCVGLTSIEIPSSVTTIGDGAFRYCVDLTSVEISSSVTTIGAFTFWECDGLTSVEISSSVTTIGDYAFYSCDGLTSIVISSSVSFIGKYAFSSCDRLTEIYSYIPADDLFIPGNYAFEGIDKEACTLYVPAGAKSTYAATDGWKDFKNIVELTNEITINDGETYTATEAQEFGKIIYNRTFNNTGWQAWYVPFAVDYNVLKEDFDVAEINNIHMYDTDDDGTLDSSTLEIISVKGGTLQANYPYFIRAKESGKKSIAVENTTLEAAQSNYIDCSSVKFKYYFIGTTTGVSGSEMYNNKYYAMSGGSMKYAQNESVSLKPFRWYMKIEARTGVALPKEVRIRHIDDITNVEEIEAVAEDNIYYDLSGRRVENPTKGIYILNGKKVFVK